jgi:ABC-type nitrate/sulfonate/bicarbonate transport system substrate-binding protein
MVMKRHLAMLGLCPILLLVSCRREPERQPGPRTRVRVSGRAALSQASIILADESGYFRRQGLDVEFVGLENSEGLPTLIEGGMDVLAGQVQPRYFNAIARGAQIRMVADRGHLDPARCGYAALVARKTLLREGRLPHPGRSKKWRIDVSPGSLGEFILDRALLTEGIDPAWVQIAPIDGRASAEALRMGALDVTLAFGAELERCQRAGEGVVWRSAESLVPNLQLMTVLYGPSLLKKDPEAGRRFMVAYLQGVRQYNEGKTTRNLEILERRLRVDRQTLLASCWMPVRDDGRVDVDSLLAIQAWAQGKGLTNRTLSAAEFWEPRFIELAARELDGATASSPIPR